MARLSTCPPEKPTATTPSSLPFERNFGLMVDGEVILQQSSSKQNKPTNYPGLNECKKE